MADGMDFSRLWSELTLVSRIPSGRPLDGEFADYAKPDIDHVSGEDAIEVLALQGVATLAILTALQDSDVHGLRYAPGKWTVKQVIGHMADDERVFAYRALCIARNDSRPLAGFDEKQYVAFADFESQSIAQLRAHYGAVRHATIALFESLSAPAWVRRGTVAGYSASARGLAYHIAGHELRHVRTLREKYGLAWNVALKSTMNSAPTSVEER